MINMKIKFNPQMHYTGAELNAFLEDMEIKVTRNLSPVSMPAGLDISITSPGTIEKKTDV